MSSNQAQRADKLLSNEELKKRIIAFFESTNMCVLATCTNNIPRATPIEYHSEGLTIYFVAEPGNKLKNIAKNPRVSIGVFLPYEGWDSAKGAQITGHATIIPRAPVDEFNQALRAYKWERTAKEMGIKEFPKTVEMVKVEPEKIEFVDMALKRSGFSARQVYLS